eukprot:793225_1
MELKLEIEILQKQDNASLKQAMTTVQDDNEVLEEEVKELTEIIQNERKAITDLENELRQQKETESESQMNVNRLRDKLSEIEIELKDRMNHYQAFERVCGDNKRFINELN